MSVFLKKIFMFNFFVDGKSLPLKIVVSKKINAVFRINLMDGSCVFRICTKSSKCLVIRIPEIVQRLDRAFGQCLFLPVCHKYIGI